MATEKTTVMVLKADLQCPCCYKKVKKLLCKFPQIRDQVYDEKANEVTITVVCCSPEKIRDKLCSKGGKVIKSIDIKEPPKKPSNPPKPSPPPPQQPEKPKEAPKPKEPEKPKEAPKPPPEKPKEAPKPPPKEPEKPKEAPKPPPKEPEKPKEAPKPQEAPKPKEPEKPKPTPPPPQKPSGPVQFHEPIKMMPPQELFPAHGFPQAVPTSCCCGPCYNGLSGGPCYHGGGVGGGYYGRPVPPPPTYDYNYGRPCYALRTCDEYFSEENPQGCFIM